MDVLREEPVGAVFVSPLTRTRQTAEPLAAATGLDRLACFPGRWDTSVEAQERFAEDCEAAGIVLDGP